MDADGRSRDLFQTLVGVDMVKMGVRIQDMGHFQLLPGKGHENAVALVSGINDNGFRRFFTPHNETIGHDRAYSQGFDDHFRPPSLRADPGRRAITGSEPFASPSR